MKMKKIHLLPNVITAFGLSCGLFAIFKIAMTPLGQADYYVVLAITGILILAAFADLLDGALARVMHAESEFGGLFDSLADAISFGVCPAVTILKTLSLPAGTLLSFMTTTAAMIFAVSGVLRLVRFNVMAQRAKGDLQQTDDNKKNFTGLPIPAAAAAALSANLLLVSDEFTWIAHLSEKTRVLILIFIMVLLGYFMVSRWKFPSLKSLHIRVASFQTVFITVLGAVVIFFGLLSHFAFVFFMLSWLYLVIAWTLSIIRLISGRKSKTLEDFEPEPDDLEID
jgi:CDP-diacylglycerol--serine O-phosphatidyltransferase